MKILKPGKVRLVKLDCPYCGCEFACDPRTEIKTEQIGEYTDTSVILRTERYVACPQCSNRFHVSLAELLEYNEEPTQDLEADRERLIGLIHEWDTKYFGGCNAAVEFLLENGVTFRG